MSCFKTYDIRGIVPTELNENMAFRIGQAFAQVTKVRRVAVGHDPRLSSPSLSRHLIRGLVQAGVQVTFLGLCGTEETYFASCLPEFDGAIMVTASHNPSEYNGMKMVLSGATPLSSTRFRALKSLAQAGFECLRPSGGCHQGSVREAYFRKLRSILGPVNTKPMKVVCNPGNGGASVAYPLLREYFEVVELQSRPDGNFPNGVPNPMYPENRIPTSELVQAEGADFGVAWDGDFDRCFLFDENGEFVENYHLAAILGKLFLNNSPGSTILHDPRLTWCIQEQVGFAGGKAVCARTGHVNIKAKMKETGAIYGGEMSGHHYFKALEGFDSGLLPALMVRQILAQTNCTLSELLAPLRDRYKVSGEINFTVQNVEQILENIERTFRNSAKIVSRVDGLSMEFDSWRFNLRASNTEPLLRLNVEAIESQDLVVSNLLRLTKLIKKGVSHSSVGISEAA